MHRFSLGSFLKRRFAFPIIVMTAVLCMLPVAAISAFAANNHTHASSKPWARTHYTLAHAGVTPPTDAQCRAKTGSPCYSPQEMRRAYTVDRLLKAGYTGKGQSIVIIDSFGSPTIAADLHTFDVGYGLSDPPSLKVIAPLGTVPFDPTNNDQVGWAFETTLDVEWAHVMAPDANIVLMTSPVSETQGVTGLPEFLFLEQYALVHHLGQVISQSWATTENTLFKGPGKLALDNFEAFYKKAGEHGISVLASSGDNGPANPDVNGNIYPFATVGYPASSPYVTAVGGTSLFADTNGNYQSETVWDEVAKQGGATGGGISQFFKEPNYQNGLSHSDQKLLNGHRGLPDISLNADPYTPILVYLSFIPGQAGYYGVGGTSESSPLLAGIVADANQYAGHPLGFLNPLLYKLGGSGDTKESFHDITVGNNSYGGIIGYNSTPGWDAATGWGTPKAANFVEELTEIAANHVD